MSGIEFEQAYDEHAWWLLAFFTHKLGSHADAEDLTQLTFERAFAAWERFDPDQGPIGAWLFTIARNLLTDHLRKAKRPHRHALPLEREGGDSGPTVPGPERHIGPDLPLELALACLQARDREIVALRFGADLTGPEIAKVTGLSVANVHQILSRSLRRMRGTIEAETAAPAASKPITRTAASGG